MSKKHHYVPRSLLRNFSVDGKREQVCVFDKLKATSYVTSVADAGSENYFNTLVVDGHVLDFEDAFQDADDALAHLVRMIVSNGRLSVLARADREQFAYLAALQFLRVGAQRSTIVDLAREIRDAVGEIAGEREKARFPETDDNQARSIVLSMLGDAERFVPAFLQKDWSLHEAPPGRTWWISDNPLAVINVFPYGDRALSAKGVELSWPLSSKYLVSFCCPTIANKVEPFSSAAAALLRSEPVHRCTAQTMEFYNSLQVLQSSRFVYGPDREFGFARRVLTENPDARPGASRVAVGGLPRKEGMPPGSWLVAYGVKTHHMVALDRWEDRDGEIVAVLRTADDGIKLLLGDGPFALVELYRDQLPCRGTRNASIVADEQTPGTVRVFSTDPAVRALDREIASRRGGVS